MKKHKKLFITLIQIIFVAAFTVGLFVFQKKQMEPQKVFVMTQEIPMGTKIVESDLKAVSVPASALQKGMVKKAKDIIGKYAAANLYTSSYAMNQMFIEKDEVDPFQNEDLDKLRKISIAVEYDEALGGNLQYGDRVDLSYVGTGESSEQGEEYTYAKTFAQNVLVFNVTTDDGYKYNDRTQRAEGEVIDDDAEATTANTATGTLKTVTLAVTPALAEEIAARKETGTISIIGRFTEADEEQTPGYIIGDYQTFYTGQGNAEAQNK